MPWREPVVGVDHDVPPPRKHETKDPVGVFGQRPKASSVHIHDNRIGSWTDRGPVDVKLVFLSVMFEICNVFNTFYVVSPGLRGWMKPAERGDAAKETIADRRCGTFTYT